MADEKQSTEFEVAFQQVKQYVDPFDPRLEKSTEQLRKEVIEWLDSQRVRFD